MVRSWSSSYSYGLLAVLTVACLLPFSGRAFSVDDTLFVWSAQQISRHPLDPYGFKVNWYFFPEPMADVTKNPPMASYYLAAVGRITGSWSERTFHLAFLFPALALILGTYRLAGHFTRFPLLAACATVLTPGVLVSACSVMCDTMMLALWVWAVILWIEGLEPPRFWYLVGAAVLTAASALTKYFGAALIPLLVAYALAHGRNWRTWAWYLLIPVATLAGYEFWTHALYGQGLISSANTFARGYRLASRRRSRTLIGLSFVGGSAISVLMFAPLVWSRKVILIATVGGVLAACAIVFGWVPYGGRAGGALAFDAVRAGWESIGVQLALYIAGGLLTLALAATDWWKRRSADSLLLGLWVVGTYTFTSFINWAVNVRSVLPMIPAAAILVMRRLDGRYERWTRGLRWQVVGALTAAGVISIWLAIADMRLANVEREAAYRARRDFKSDPGTLWFEGHWGFQYYMEKSGALPVDARDYRIRPGETVLVQDDGLPLALPRNLLFRQDTELEFPVCCAASTMSWRVGAGFYDSYFGPLPFAFGHIPPYTYRRLEATSLPPASASTHSSDAVQYRLADNFGEISELRSDEIRH